MTKNQKKFNLRKWKLDDLPDSIFIETFMGCNLRCKMCPVPSSDDSMSNRKPTAMSAEVYSSIIEQVSERPRTIILNQLGEPLLHKDIVNLVAMAKKEGHDVGFTTNATKLSEKMSHQLLERRRKDPQPE